MIYLLSIDIVDFDISIIFSSQVLMFPAIYVVCCKVSRQLGQATPTIGLTNKECS